MITITRSLARQVRKILKAVFGNHKYPALHVHVDASSKGLQVWAATFEGAVLYTDEASRDTDSLVLPFEALADVEGAKDTPVTLTTSGSSVDAAWHDAQVPMHRSYLLLHFLKEHSV